jgi:competence protein ComEA
LEVSVRVNGQHDSYQWLTILAVLILAGLGATLWYVRQPASQAVSIEISTPPPAVQATPNTSKDASKTVKVYVTGAVMRPGVFTVSASARVEDVVKSAGGFTFDAARDQVNLAASVTDGQHIRIPAHNEVTSPPPNQTGKVGASLGKLNINTASVADLEKLPRIGSAIAARIVSYRESHGPFTSIEQLKELKIVRESDFEQIMDLITVS